MHRFVRGIPPLRPTLLVQEMYTKTKNKIRFAHWFDIFQTKFCALHSTEQHGNAIRQHMKSIRPAMSILELPIELWHEIMLFLSQHIARTFLCWSRTSRLMQRIANAETMWIARLRALHAAREVRGIVIANMPLTPTVYSQLHDVPTPLRWTAKQCFLHYFFAATQRCILCCCIPCPANQPMSTLRLSQSGGGNDTLLATRDASELNQSSLIDTMRRFPYEGTNICVICLRRYFLLKSSLEGKAEAARGDRRFFLMHRWVVCLRRDIERCVTHQSTEDEASSKRKRPSARRVGFQIGGRSSDSDDDVEMAAVVVPQQQHYLTDPNSSRLLMYDAQQQMQKKYLSPNERSHFAPCDPLKFLDWNGHTLLR